MKALQFMSLLLILIFSTSGCVNQAENNFKEMETQVEEANMRRTYPPKIASITPFCDERGNIEKVIVTHANYASSVTLDIFSEDGTQHIARHTEANPEADFQIDFFVGSPLDGSYGCSYLTAGTTYRIRVSNDPNIDPIWFPWDPWPLPNIIDEFTTIEPCTCTIRR